MLEIGTQETLVAFKRVAAVIEIPEGRGLCVRVGELEIGLYRVGEGYFAMDNVCPHAGYPLCDGELEDSTIMCPGHGWVFDVQTGLAPGEVEETPLVRYPVRIEGDDLWIDVDEPLLP